MEKSEKEVIEHCIKVLEEAIINHAVYTSYDSDIAEGVREELIQSLRNLLS